MTLTPYKRKAFYYETDRMDIIHHSNYVRWLEEARVDLMEQLGCPFHEIEERGIVSPVLSVETHYKYPVRFGDEFEVRCKLSKFNGCAYELDYEVFDLTTQKTACLAHTSHCFTSPDLKPVRLKNIIPISTRNSYPHIRQVKNKQKMYSSREETRELYFCVKMTDVTCHEESNPSTPSRHFSKLHKPSFAQRHSEHSISNAFLSILLLSLVSALR